MSTQRVGAGQGLSAHGQRTGVPPSLPVRVGSRVASRGIVGVDRGQGIGKSEWGRGGGGQGQSRRWQEPRVCRGAARGSFPEDEAGQERLRSGPGRGAERQKLRSLLFGETRRTRAVTSNARAALSTAVSSWELGISDGPRRKPASSAGGSPRSRPPGGNLSLQPKVLGKSLETGPRPQGKACGQAHQKPPQSHLAFLGGKRPLGTSRTQKSALPAHAAPPAPSPARPARPAGEN